MVSGGPEGGTLKGMHRTVGKDPEFQPGSYGEIWVRVFDAAEDEDGTAPTWRHFHVSPQQAHEMTIAEAVANVEVLNEGEQHHSHRFEYYAVEVHTDRVVRLAAPTHG